MLQKQPPSTLPIHLLFFILPLHSFIVSCQRVCNHQDQFALFAFSKNISTSPSLPLNWSSSTTCCQWEGIECDINGRVIHLQLPSRGLKGVITSSISNLVMLTHLNLSNNHLQGLLGEEISSLTNLRVLDLSSNTFLGSIPAEIGMLLHLRKLHLYENNLNGPIPPSLMKCTRLVEILLRDNHLTGDISKLDFSRLVQLQKLDLKNNNLNGTLPESIYSCKSLVAIRVTLNNITGQISPKITKLKSLSFVSLSQTSITNITASLRVLAQCKNLTTLFLAFNFYDESLPVYRNFIGAGEFPKLQFFFLHNCKFAPGPIPNWLSTLKTLRVLCLQGNQMRGTIPNWLGTLPNLFRLELNNNSLFGDLPLRLCQLSSLSSQNAKADLKLSQFELPVFFVLANGDTYYRFNYRGIDLSHNALSGNILKEIGNLQSLQELNLNDNHFSGHIPIAISNLKNLEVLNLSTNHLTGEIPISLVSLNFLSRFDASYNDLGGPIPTGGQFDTFQESSFEGNPGLCGELVNRPCSNSATSKVMGSIESHDTFQPFLDGLFVGFASGFSSILIVVASYVWFNNCKWYRASPRRGQVEYSINKVYVCN